MPLGCRRSTGSNRPPRWRINSLWWPTGASRFAIGLFLTTLSRRQRHQAAMANTNGGSGTLVMSDGTRSIALRRCGLLPMRPIGAVGTDNPCGALAAGRYSLLLAVGINVRPDVSWSRQATWDDVRTRLSPIGRVQSRAADPGRTIRRQIGRNGPLSMKMLRFALDGYAATIGQRFVASHADGSLSIAKGSDVGRQRIANLNRPSGQDGRRRMPHCRRPSFRKRRRSLSQRRQGGIPYQNGVCDLVTKASHRRITALHLRDRARPSFTRRFRPTTRVAHPGRAINLDAMSSLADAIARDFYGWKQKQYSATLPGARLITGR
jgi:hypothetical protein